MEYIAPGLGPLSDPITWLAASSALTACAAVNAAIRSHQMSPARNVKQLVLHVIGANDLDTHAALILRYLFKVDPRLRVITVSYVGLETKETELQTLAKQGMYCSDFLGSLLQSELGFWILLLPCAMQTTVSS